ncbi:hypothetical protein MYX82_03835, partial [Acidobacteria bacterium AH-259-D05]|nr:hypothetical protein [Acidobacteria bacterium AH-259-D05]
GILFALTVGEIAVQFSNLVTENGLNDTLPAYAHLGLAFGLVSASWVGWSLSEAPGNRLPITTVFSWPFLVLVIDVILVIFYFILVKGVDVPGKPSAAHEARWVTLIFALYLVWDFLTKAVIKSPGGTETFCGRLLSKTFWGRGWGSLACAVSCGSRLDCCDGRDQRLGCCCSGLGAVPPSFFISGSEAEDVGLVECFPRWHSRTLLRAILVFA